MKKRLIVIEWCIRLMYSESGKPEMKRVSTNAVVDSLQIWWSFASWLWNLIHLADSENFKKIIETWSDLIIRNLSINWYL